MEQLPYQYSALTKIALLKEYKSDISIKKSGVNSKSLETQEYFKELLSINTSLVSKFSDQEWDYNADNPNVSANIKGSKLKINFQKYKHIPQQIIIELKCILLNVLLTPEIFMNSRRKAKKKATTQLATNTVLAHMKSGLRFLDALFIGLKTKFGQEHIDNYYSSLTQLNSDDYRDKASSYCGTYNDDLKQFFSYILNPHTSTHIFGESIPIFDSEQFSWKKRYKKQVSDRVLPNSAFDQLVRISSLLVHDFLKTMGENVSDINVNKYAAESKQSYCENVGITEKTFQIYRAYRLLSAGYDEEFVEKYYFIPEELRNSKDKFNLKDMAFFLNKKHSTQFTFAAVCEHLALVSHGAKYLIGQYTGMRPSEMAVLDIETCLTEEEGIKLIKSHVFKGKHTISKGLFEDMWVAIPIVEDALNAIRILNTITQRKFVFSSSHTKKVTESENPSTSAQISYQLKLFVKFASPNDNLGFNNYMMRHTLAYQLYRLEAGLPLISFQLKHLVNTVDKFLTRGSTSDVTMGYGGIADSLVESQTAQRLRKQSEIEVIKATADPDGNYLGGKAAEHKERLRSAFKGYMASGYSKDEIFEAMADQGLGVINVGLGYCYGSNSTNTDLPCIGSLRCNPNRCANAIVSEANAPYWREIYNTNRANLNNPTYQDNYEQIQEVISEAKQVLELLGHSVDDE